jgi:hypothetical protein
MVISSPSLTSITFPVSDAALARQANKQIAKTIRDDQRNWICINPLAKTGID